ncbi:HAD domain-containing protein [Glycomyces endophyticus]|uniref:HAD domain-containing protein n=1 Tax=Glycomyces endophyticus TaxID=480996 RepID=A0ABP4STP3_9ACTN
MTPPRRTSARRRHRGTGPLLFLDVDGTLIPFGQSEHQVPLDSTSDSYLSRLDPQIGTRLTALPFQLVWATTWEDDANTVVAPRLGLPLLPVVRWPEPTPADELEDQWFNLHWKTRTLVAWAAGRPFVWVDDEITEADEDWVEKHHPGRALLHRVEPAQGITYADLNTIDTWIRAT